MQVELIVLDAILVLVSLLVGAVLIPITLKISNTLSGMQNLLVTFTATLKEIMEDMKGVSEELISMRASDMELRKDIDEIKQEQGRQAREMSKIGQVR